MSDLKHWTVILLQPLPRKLIAEKCWPTWRCSSVDSWFWLLQKVELLHLVLKEALHDVGTAVVLGVGLVVWSAVGEDAGHVRSEQALVCVVAVLQLLWHRPQIWRANTMLLYIMYCVFKCLERWKVDFFK